MAIIDALAYLICLGAPAAVLFFGISRFGPRRPPSVDLAFAIGIPVLMCLAFIAWAREERVAVTMEGADEEKSIQYPWLTIQGSVSPPTATVFVLVRPVGADDNSWWVQPVTMAPSGAWQCNANFGTLEDGNGELYAVLAVGTTMPWLARVLYSNWLGDAPLLYRLPFMASSHVALVKRGT